MDIVVADVPPKFVMFLSRSWIKKLGGTLQMDLTYATIPFFRGEHRRLYRESQTLQGFYREWSRQSREIS
jgi:hypothetical protein